LENANALPRKLLYDIFLLFFCENIPDLDHNQEENVVYLVKAFFREAI
jgi:hypothetical protein